MSVMRTYNKKANCWFLALTQINLLLVKPTKIQLNIML